MNIDHPYFDPDFFSPEEISLSRKFISQGYVILDSCNALALNEFREHVAQIIGSNINNHALSINDLLNSIHSQVRADELNNLRLRIIESLNSTGYAKTLFFSVARRYLEILVGNELVMQRRLNLSIQMPHDINSLLPIHSDVWSGDSPFEVVGWLPLVDCYKTKSMYILPPKASQRFHDNFKEVQHLSSEEVFSTIENDVEWLEVDYGQVVLFNQSLPHGNRQNLEKETRWSINCRFKSIFSPYHDKRMGEFFEPVTVRAVTRGALRYQFPGSNN